MKHVFLHTMMFCHLLSLFSQEEKRNYNWVIGSGSVKNCTINFSSGYPVIDTVTVAARLHDINASMSDTNGNILFYTNGYKIINKNHQLMDNGDSITCCIGVFQQGMQNGFGAPQSALILPKPGSSNLYYVFNESLDIWATTPYFQYTPLVYYSVVDMSYNGGLGKVVQKNIPLLSDTLNIGFLTACRHANGRDWWMLIREYESNRYHRFLISPSGVQEIGIQIVGNPIPQYSYGQTIFSPDGSKFVCVQKDQYTGPVMHYFVYDFDRCTGLLSNYITDTLTNGGAPTGIAFSPNNRYLYISSAFALYQFDMQDVDWQTTQQTIASWSTWQDSVGNTYSFGFMTSAPNRKIYMGCIGSPYLNVIHSPDSAGTACTFTHHSLALTANNGRCMPNFPHFRLGALVGSGCDTLQHVGVAAPFDFAQGAVKVYPNPATDLLHITGHPPHSYAIVYDMLGNEALRSPILDNKIDIRSLQNGVYLIQIENAGKVLSLQKLIIIR